ncbi:MAG: winged helix-turn-helix domain-containing protein [Candidatus Bathyarchaeota archaeon]|nr:winged helix-turn-helix domain-containing protein [Candidatus Bathyarchaeota archaeon]
MFAIKSALSLSFLHAFKYRDRVGIMADILKAVKSTREGESKYGIMQNARLNYVQTKKYIHYMVNCGYLVVSQRETYLITEKGARFLQFIEIQRMQAIK